jgi:hypothetical protein
MGQSAPIYIRTNLSHQEDSGKVGDCKGIEMYWSFEVPNPDES